jgi:hypothetical protein
VISLLFHNSCVYRVECFEAKKKKEDNVKIKEKNLAKKNHLEELKILEVSADQRLTSYLPK